MNRSPHVVAIPGSLRDGSYTRVAVRHALAAADERGATTELIDLREYEMPVFDSDDRNPGDVRELRRRVFGADAVVLGTPVYHRSYSSPLKTAFDYLGSDEFEGRTVGLLAVGGGSTLDPALDHLEAVCAGGVSAWVLPTRATVGGVYERVDDGEIVDEDAAKEVAEFGRTVVEAAVERPDPHPPLGAEATGADD